MDSHLTDTPAAQRPAVGESITQPATNQPATIPPATGRPSIDPPGPLGADLAPLLPEEEWANALTHAAAALAWMFGAVLMVRAAVGQPLMTALCCLVFVLSAVSVFSASALSHHLLHCPRLLHRLRAWDQGLIYVMISGTYTPLIWQFANPTVRGPLLVAIWVAAAVGFHSKVFAGHRINGIGTLTYLLLGWLPALGLVGRVPTAVLVWMAVGGVVYTLGVVLLMNDKRRRYLHALWHVCVVVAASCHFWAIYRYVATA